MGDEETNVTVLESGTKRKGGFKAATFVFIMTGLDNMGFVANMVGMVVYFMTVMHFDGTTSANTLTNFMGSTFLLTIVGGFISDTYLNRLHTGFIFGAIQVLGLAMVTIQAYAKGVQPKETCVKDCVQGGVAWMFYGSLAILAMGSGGARGALPALGADQFDQKDPKEAKAIGTYFNYILLVSVIGAAVGLTAIAYVSVEVKWYWGFLIATIGSAIAYIVLAFGTPYYRLQQPGDSPILRIFQVIFLAFKKRKLPLPENVDELYEVKESEVVSSFKERILHTNQFRFLDKAAIVVDKESSPCTVTQVEEVKILTRMVPILASTVIMNTCMAQLQTYSVQQGYYMEPHLGSLKVPPQSIPVIPIVFMALLLPLYELFFVPFARNITNHPSGITQLKRVGVGLVLSAISMAVSGFVEVKRKDNLFHLPPKQISLFWLSFQYAIFGIADMFTLVGLLEFFYKEAPVGMRSLSTSFTWLSLSFGYFLSTVLVSIINSVTKGLTMTKTGWLEGPTINQYKLNNFYWFLSVLSILNFGNYLFWASWYKYKVQDSGLDQFDDAKPKVVSEAVVGGLEAPVKDEGSQVDESKVIEQPSSVVESQTEVDAVNKKIED